MTLIILEYSMNPTIFNPMASKQTPWHIAIARRNFITMATLPMIWSECFWKTWYQVYKT